MKNWNTFTLIGDTYDGFWEGYTTQIYSEYINNHDEALTLFYQLMEENKPFRSFASNAQKVAGIDLVSCLNLPLQRLPRFLDMLRNLLELTPLTHPDMVNLQRAYNHAKTSVEEINNLKKKSDDMKKLKSLAERLEGLPSEVIIASPSRSFVKQTSISDNKGHAFQLILLSDLVIVAVAKKDKLKVQKYALTTEVSMPETVQISRGQLGFSLQIGGTSFTFVPDEEEDHRSWIAAFRSVLKK